MQCIVTCWLISSWHYIRSPPRRKDSRTAAHHLRRSGKSAPGNDQRLGEEFEARWSCGIEAGNLFLFRRSRAMHNYLIGRELPFAADPAGELVFPNNCGVPNRNGSVTETLLFRR